MQIQRFQLLNKKDILYNTTWYRKFHADVFEVLVFFFPKVIIFEDARSRRFLVIFIQKYSYYIQILHYLDSKYGLIENVTE